jgi:hypothetical protein
VSEGAAHTDEVKPDESERIQKEAEAIKLAGLFPHMQTAFVVAQAVDGHWLVSSHTEVIHLVETDREADISDIVHGAEIVLGDVRHLRIVADVAANVQAKVIKTVPLAVADLIGQRVELLNAQQAAHDHSH